MKKLGPGSPRTVDEYLARTPEPARGTLRKIRMAIKAAAPRSALETISYGMPAFKYNGVLAYFAAFSDHCSLFPTAGVMRQFEKELRNYSTSKGTIRFAIDKPLPAALVKKIVKARVKQIEGRKGKTRG